MTKEIYGYPIDLTKEEVDEILSNVKTRITHSKKTWDFGCPEFEIFYKRKWMRICTTDLKDDVGIMISHTKAFKKDPIAYLKRKNRYGARLRNNGFAIINAISDG